MGKRVNFSARTVIGGDPNLSIAQVGVPRSIAKELTFPERVTNFNMDHIRRLIDNGPDKHPGARTIIRNDGQLIDLNYVRARGDLHLETGYVVERHIQDGDVVIFNRQPTLHKMSMMAHRVKILPYSTFRLNLSVTTPYNADFDGDEMNLHVPQSHLTRSECLNLMAVPRMIVTPQSNRPVMGIVQDTLLGVMKFTKRDMFFDKKDVMNLLMWLDTDEKESSWDGKLPMPAIVHPTPLWSGKQLFSIVTPKVNMEGTSSTHPDDENDYLSVTDTRVRIEDGDLLMGIIDKRTLGRSMGSLIHVIFNEKGPNACKLFVDEVQLLVTSFLLNFQSMTIGVGDTIADSRTLRRIDRTIGAAYTDVDDVIEQARKGDLERDPGETLVSTFENKVNRLLNEAMNKTGKAVKAALRRDNNIKAMVEAGSKGNLINVAQIIGCVGQQNVQGKRIPFGFRDRSLPHFTKGDVGPASRGYVARSYLRGLTPYEVFFHAMGGREGLVDTAVKTAETGYIQRRLVKAMEDVTVCYDGTVRNSLGGIMQFLYGEDGMDGAHIEAQKLDIITMSDETFRRTFHFSLDEVEGACSHKVRRRIETDERALQDLEDEYAQLQFDRKLLRKEIWPLLDHSTKVYLPVNLRRLIWSAQRKYTDESLSAVDPVTVIRAVREVCETALNVVPHARTSDDELSSDAQRNATLLFAMLLRSILSSKRVCLEWRLTPDAFNWVLGSVRTQFATARAHAGEMVGVLAAQSIGEPATQMTLNTFHFAGYSGKNVTLGVPRLRELINVAKTIKTPSLTVYLTPEFRQDKSTAHTVGNRLEFVRLGDLVIKTQLFYDPEPDNSTIVQDRKWLEDVFDPDLRADDDIKPEELSPWLLRIELDMPTRDFKGLSNAMIADRINTDFDSLLYCVASPDNYKSAVLQVRMIQRDEDTAEGAMDDDADDVALLKKIESLLLDKIELAGLPGIGKVFTHEETTYDVDPKTGGIVEGKEVVLDTEGCQLLRALAIDGVDPYRTRSNDISEILEVFGIEAARKALFDEIRRVISFDGSYVNYRHLAILVDVMTCEGHLMSITRNGINARETGPLMRCSFEETVEILMEAAAFAETDHLRGVSERIILGRVAPAGTGVFSMVLDIDSLKNAVHIEAKEAWEADIALGGDLAAADEALRALSPVYDASGGAGVMMTDAAMVGSFSPVVQHGEAEGGQAASPAYVASPEYAPASPSYEPSAASPAYSPASPAYNAASPGYSPTSPAYEATSPGYSPTSPGAYSWHLDVYTCVCVCATV
ncbi:MAG: hypothetical protein MHM6MM_002470 [Cercozoa sp. M6MM]